MITTRSQVDADELDDALRRHHVPGERVRVDRKVRLAGEDQADALARHESFGDGECLIEEFIVDANGTLKYRFAGIDGEHPVAAFRDVEALSHCYGVLLAMDGELWLVPFDGGDGDKARTVGTPMQVDPELDRLATYWVGPYGPGELVASAKEEPWAGEFTHSDPTTGPCRLKGSSWHSSTSSAELTAAREAVEDHVAALALSARSLH